MGEIWQKKTKSEAQNFNTGVHNFTKNLVKNLVIKQSSYTSSSSSLSSDIDNNNNNNNNNSTFSAAEMEQKILNIIVQKSTVFFLIKSLQNVHI
jgi:hypothetical protein